MRLQAKVPLGMRFTIRKGKLDVLLYLRSVHGLKTKSFKVKVCVTFRTDIYLGIDHF